MKLSVQGDVTLHNGNISQMSMRMTMQTVVKYLSAHTIV